MKRGAVTGRKRPRVAGKKGGMTGARTASRTTGPRNKKPVGAYRHGAGRKNLPTDQTGRNMDSKDARPVPYRLPPGKPDRLPADMRPPHLAWARDPPDHTPAGQLYIHEKLHPAAFATSLKKNHDSSLDSFFGSYDGLPKGAEFEWYQHSGHWQNRLIRGESRHVMASLLAREGMAGKVQMVYFDPPYGINFRNILQANVDKDRDAKKIPNDPVALQTFRDTYKNGIHSYLDNIHQIASHARELLGETGSFFLQIGTANVNRVGVVLDEVFGADNRVGMITFAKTSGSSSKNLPEVADYLLWYAKDKQHVKYHQLYEPTPTKKDMLDLMSTHAMVELEDGTVRKPTPEEKHDPDTNLPNGARLFKSVSLSSQGRGEISSEDYTWDNKVWKCPITRHWSVTHKGLDRLAKLGRLHGSNKSLNWKKYANEFPGRRINNIWIKQAQARDKHYVVETAESTIEKCVLMATDPGDLVFDPTCGSGTTAYVAEKWGRRWITSDAGLVAVNLARQRIIAGVFPWHKLIDSEEGHRRENEMRNAVHQPLLPEHGAHNEDPSAGFVYERMPKVSPQYLAYPESEAPVDYMVDRPEEDGGRIRVSSPFTVESQSPHRYVDPQQPMSRRHSPARRNVVEALRSTGIRIEGSNTHLAGLDEYPGRVITHTATFGGRHACILVAEDDCTVPQVMIDHAAEEAASMPKVTALIIVAFAYEPFTENGKRGRLNIYKAMANRDLQMGNLEDGKDDITFVLVGEPDVKVETRGGKMTAEIIGYDTFHPANKTTRPGIKDDVYCWMVDTEYDGRSFFARRIHFPGAGSDRQIGGFYTELKKHIDPGLWESMLSLKSAPFSVPKSGRIAVKIITSAHEEMITVRDVKT